jgi:hypothetical protein
MGTVHVILAKVTMQFKKQWFSGDKTWLFPGNQLQAMQTNKTTRNLRERSYLI